MNVIAQGIEISEIPQSISSGELKLYLDRDLTTEQLQSIPNASQFLRILTVPLTKPATVTATQVSSFATILGWQVLSDSNFMEWVLGGFAYFVLYSVFSKLIKFR